MKKMNALKYAISASLMALALTACSKKQDESANADVKVAEPVVQEIQAVCDEPSLKNRLVDAVQAGLLDSALLAVQGYEDAARLGLEQQVRQKLSEINIDVQNVASSGATCRADVHFTLPAQDVAYANQTFENTGLAALDEQAAEASAALVGGNRLIAKNFAYTIEENKAQIGTDNAIVNLVANTLVASAHGMAGETRANAKNAPSVRLEPVQPIIAPRVQLNNDESEPQAAHPEPVTRPNTNQERPQPIQPKAEKPKTEQPKADAVKPRETVRPAEQKPKTEPVKPKAEPAPAKTNTATEKAPVHKPVANENVELTIVESDDTY